MVRLILGVNLSLSIIEVVDSAHIRQEGRRTGSAGCESRPGGEAGCLEFCETRSARLGLRPELRLGQKLKCFVKFVNYEMWFVKRKTIDVRILR